MVHVSMQPLPPSIRSRDTYIFVEGDEVAEYVDKLVLLSDLQAFVQNEPTLTG